jgi:hypothetical protein
MLILQLLIVLMFWITIATTEGWKWRQNDGKLDNSKIITWNTYHIWRSFTTLSVLLMPLVYVNISTFLCAHVIGWISYERWMSLVEYDTLLYKRPKYHLVNKIWINRPSPKFEIAVIISAIITYIETNIIF